MANITVTEAANFIPEIWAATALGALKANTVMTRLVTRDYDDEVAKAGDIVHVPKRGTLVVNTKVANAVVTLQTPSSDVVNVTLDKHKEVTFLVEDVARAQANQDIIQGYIMDGMIAIAHQMDADLLGLYTDLTFHTPIDATAGLGDDDVREARRLLNSAKVPLTNRYFVMHEDTEKEALGVEKFINMDYGVEGDAIREASMGRRFGFSFFMDQMVAVAAGECKNIAFHRDALALVTRPLPEVPSNMGAYSANMVEDNVSIRVLWSYNPSYLGVQVTLDVLYGVAVLQANHGAVIRTTEI